MPDFFNPLNLAAIGFEVAVKSLFALAIIALLKEISPQNRRIVPSLVWLLIIPGFNLVWNFFVAIRVSMSIKNELAERNFDVKGYPTLIIGLGYAAISSAALFVPAPKDIQNSATYGILGLIAIIIFIQYWMKINWYKTVMRDDSGEHDVKEVS